MRKTIYILLGLSMIAVAVLFGGYRHVLEPRSKAARTPEASVATRSLDRARPEGSTRSAQPATRERSPGPSSQKVDSIATFATVIDVLNVVVGIVGIVLAIMGMRMQRQAMAMQSARIENRQG